MRKTYTHKQVNYGSKGPKWNFAVGDFILVMPLAGGVETAHKVARVVSGSFDRTGTGLDNLGRANIQQILDKIRQNAEAARE